MRLEPTPADFEKSMDAAAFRAMVQMWVPLLADHWSSDTASEPDSRAPGSPLEITTLPDGASTRCRAEGGSYVLPDRAFSVPS
jgi:hypothetical protein